MQRAGIMTYLAFLLAQIGATIIALFGFNGYEHPKDGYSNCQFCRLSTGGPVSSRGNSDRVWGGMVILLILQSG
jgi:hypothetical protein